MDSNATVCLEPNADAFGNIPQSATDGRLSNRIGHASESVGAARRMQAGRFAWWRKKTSPAILGSDAAVRKVMADPGLVAATPFPPHRLVPPGGDRDRCPLPTAAELRELIERSNVDHVIVALPLPDGSCIKSILGRAIDLGTRISLVDSEMAHCSEPRSLVWHVQMLAKAAIDRLGAALLLVMLSPLLVLAALLVRLTSPGPALFIQPRLGRDNMLIPVVKLRTMYVDQADWWGSRRTVPGDPRVTPVGRLLRRWSLDELPQLFNVLAGHMSLVGPRPHAVTMTAGDRLYFEAMPGYLARHRVKPGITGWAQVNRLSGQVDSVAAGQARLDHDLHYIENWSIRLDLEIFWKTIRLFFDRANRY